MIKYDLSKHFMSKSELLDFFWYNLNVNDNSLLISTALDDVIKAAD